jgi:hypothetical protein
LIIQLGEPIERSVSARITLRLKKAPLVAPTIASAPWVWRTCASRSAISSSASSHEMRAHFPSPRAPARRCG